jgi:hypothetical protein
LFDLKIVKKRKKEKKTIKLKETPNILLGKVKRMPKNKILKNDPKKIRCFLFIYFKKIRIFSFKFLQNNLNDLKILSYPNT